MQVRKLNPVTTLLLGLSVLSFALPSPGFADNNKRKHYKGEVAANYKGEIGSRLPAPAPKPRPIMAPVILKDGPYIGISAGYDSYKVQQLTQFTGTTSTTYNPTINATGLIGSVMAGYGHYFNNALYLGFEGFGNISEAYQSTNVAVADTTDNISYNAKFFATWGYGVSLLPGIKLSDSALVFVKLGFQVARLRGQEDLTDSGTLIVSNTSSWNGGFTYGLGFEEGMVENLSLRGEYSHTDYRSFTATSGTQYSPSNNQFMLSLVYHFT
jgi:opacity protein-like surface antigen